MCIISNTLEESCIHLVLGKWSWLIQWCLPLWFGIVSSTWWDNQAWLFEMVYNLSLYVVWNVSSPQHNYFDTFKAQPGVAVTIHRIWKKIIVCICQNVGLGRLLRVSMFTYIPVSFENWGRTSLRMEEFCEICFSWAVLAFPILSVFIW